MKEKFICRNPSLKEEPKKSSRLLDEDGSFRNKEKRNAGNRKMKERLLSNQLPGFQIVAFFHSFSDGEGFSGIYLFRQDPGEESVLVHRRKDKPEIAVLEAEFRH